MLPLHLGVFAAAALLGSQPVPAEIRPATESSTKAPAELSIAGRSYRRVERRANVFTSSAQEAAALDADAFGRTVIVWQSRRQEEGTYGVFARRFAPDGGPLSEEVHVNTSTESQQTNPAVAVDPAGAWFVWESFGQDGDEGSIIARRFDASLASAGTEILVNEGRTEGHQESPVVAALARGGAIVAWTTPGGAPAERWIVARQLDADGDPLGGVFRVDSAPGFRDTIPCLEAVPGGGFVVAWARARSDGRPAGIFARRFGADSAPLGGEVEVSERDGRMHIEPVLALAPDGSMTFAWFSSREDGSGGESYGVTLRLARPTEKGLELGPQRSLETRLSAKTRGSGDAVIGAAAESPRVYTSGLALSCAPDGRMLLAWNRCGDPETKSDLFARLLGPQGDPLGDVFPVSAAVAEHQRLQAASGARHALLAGDGRMAFAWSGNAELGDTNGAHLTLFTPADLDLAALVRRAPEPVKIASAGSQQGGAPADSSEESSGDGASPDHHVPPTFDRRSRADRSQLPDAMNTSGPDFGFLGIVNTGWTPPDPHLSVGPDHVVLMTNGHIQFMQKNGTLDFQQDIVGAGGFWGAQGAGGFVFDPETCYDPGSGRFMAMAAERFNNVQSFFLFAVSDDSNPNGTWHKYRFDVTALAGNDIDSPELAVDGQAVYLCADFFTPADKFLVFTVDKAAVLTGAVPTTRSLLITGSQSYGVPATYGSPPAQYMIQALEAASNTQIILHGIRNPLTLPTDTTFTLNVPAYQQPEDPPQMGSSVHPEVFESRFWSCTYRNGSLWATHHTGSSRVRQRWYQIDMASWPTSGTPTVVQQGDIDLGPTVRTYFGSIWADASNDAAMVFSRSSPTEFISIARCFRRASDPLGTMNAAVTAHSSTSADNSGRWGDYSNVTDDPAVPGAFWSHNEFRTSTWMTWVDLFGPCEAPSSYCTGKVNSIGQTPFIGSSGEASVGLGSFQVQLNNALPNRLALLYYSDNPDSTPFAGGTRCVLPPLFRGGTFTTNGAGFGSVAHSIGIALLGKHRYFQIFSRDHAVADGSGLSLTDGLSIVVCP